MNWGPTSKEQQLINAAKNGHKDVVKELLNEEDIDINATNKKSMFSTTQKTALMYASEKGHKEVVTTLLNGGYKKKIHCFAIGQGEKIMLYDYKDKKEIYQFYNDNDDGDYLASRLAFSPNGKILAVVWEYNTVYLDEKKCILSLYNVNLSESDKKITFIEKKTNYQNISSIAFSPNGKILAVGYGEMKVTKSKMHSDISSYTQYIQLYRSNDGVKTWEEEEEKIKIMKDNKEIKEIKEYNDIDDLTKWNYNGIKYNVIDEDRIDTIAFSPDNKSLAVGVTLSIKSEELKSDLQGDVNVNIIKICSRKNDVF